MRITVLDNDDLDPKFTRDVYKAKIYEFYPMPVSVLFFFTRGHFAIIYQSHINENENVNGVSFLHARNVCNSIFPAFEAELVSSLFND